MSLFNGAQSFYIDPTVVQGSTTVDLAAVSLFFMYRPSVSSNKSGVQYPGITMFLTDVVNGLPNMANVAIFQNIARCEWNAISTSSDASAETVFTFRNPITLNTKKAYAMCWAYDSGEDFLPWTNIKGHDLVGTTQISTGPSSLYGGSYFLFSSILGANATIQTIQNYQTAWTPVQSTDAKFRVYAARYSVNSVPIAANLSSLPLNTPVFTSNLFYTASNSGVSVVSPSPRVENINFDIQSSVKQSYVGAQRVYQNTVHYPGGGVTASVVTTGSNTVVANATMSNGAAFSWNTIYNGYTGDKYVVVDYGTSVDVRKITSIVSNTVIVVDEATTASSSNALIMISPVAVTDSFNTSYLSGQKSSLMFMRDSSANSSVRFVGYSVDFSNVSFSNTGLGYSNSDVLYVLGYNNVNNAITSNYPAVANLSTNSVGGVLSLNWSNTGSGFVNSAQVVFVVLTAANSLVNSVSTNTSLGANLHPILNFGTTLITEQTNNIFRNCRPIDIDVHTVMPVMNLVSTANTTHSLTLSTLYYMANNSLTPNGYCTYVGTPQVFPLQLGATAMLNSLVNIPVVVSRSNEFTIHYANGVMNDQVTAVNPYSNCYTINMEVTSNNDYVAVGPFHSPLLDFGRYIFNNDYTNENTDSGNAVARHITTVFSISGPANTNLMAEDIRLYLSAWRPLGTDIQAFARIQNSTDSEAFNDEDWTRLTLIEGSNTFSTTGYTDLAFGFQGQPNTTQILVGTVTTTNGSTTVTGSNTNWQTSLAANTLVKIYDPLFANSDFAVALVTAVGSNTSITVDQPFNTNTQLGIGGVELTGRGGLNMDVLSYGFQAFNNPQNDSIVRYYNESEHVYDGFNTVQIKCVLLSSDPHSIPRIHNLRGVGLSA